MSASSWKKSGLLLVLLFGTAASAPQFTSSDYILRFIALIFFWIGAAGCWNLSSGHTGYIDFGPVVYFGIGSYVTGIAMTKYGLPFWPAPLLSGLTAALTALPVGLATLRIRGAYFAVATFAFAEAMKQTILEFDRLFRVRFFEGSDGITLPISPYGNDFFLYCTLCATAAVMVLHIHAAQSKYGYGLKAVHEAEPAAELAGVDTLTIKLRAYVTSAFLLGIFGSIEAYWITYITPGEAFNINKTVQMVIMTLLGGMGTVFGPVVGAGFLTVISEVFGTRFVEYYLILLAIIIAVILFMPRGVMGTLAERSRPTSIE